MLERPWHKHWPQGVPKSIDYPDLPVQSLLRQAARQHAGRVAVSFYGKEISYRELDDAADRFAAGLRKIGVRPGDRVSLMLPNTPHLVVGFFGTLRAGGTVVQTNPLYTPRELVALWKDAGVETVITLDLFWHATAEARLAAGVKRVILGDVAEYLRSPLRQLYPIKKKRDLKKQGRWPLEIPEEPWLHRFASLLENEPEPDREPPVRPAEDVAVLQYTGGTTGASKGAMLTHRNLVVNALQASAWLPEKRPDGERILGAIPMFHIYGLTFVLLTSIVMGAVSILHPNPREIGHILKLIDRTKPTIFPAVPTMYIAVVRHPKASKYDLSSLKACISGAAPLPNEVRHEFQNVTKGKIVEGYGLTEASPVTHVNPLQGLVKECIGIPLPDTDAKIVDLENPSKELPLGGVGELAIRGPQVMKGYWNRPEETAQVLRDGWLLTGDIARMDEDGYFYIVDRKKDMIICSGYNVYPREVEEVLFEHSAIAEAVAIGVPDAYRGETVKAFVVLKAGRTATEEEIIAFCKERLAPYKVPKSVEFATDLPKSLVGKVLRRELRERERAKTQARN